MGFSKEAIYKIILILVILFAFFARTLQISNYPAGFTQDEAGIGYEAYSILKTGKDSWGVKFPLTLRSFGDFKLPLYSYLTIPSIAIFGLKVFAVRLPSAIFGTLAVLTTYLMVSELSGRKSWAILSALLLALSPWSISLSRGAFEANLTTFFIPLGIWSFFKAVKNPKFMLLSAIAFGLNLFSYHSARIFTLLLVAVLLFTTYQKLKNNYKKYLPSLIVFSFLTLVMFYSLLLGSAKRGSDVTIFNPTDKWAYVSERRYEAVLAGLPDTISRIFSNKIVYVVSTFSKNYVSYLSGDFLFLDGAGEWTYGMIPGRGVLYFVEIFFVIAALVAFIRGSRSIFFKLIIYWILLSPIAVSISKNVGFAANRISVMMPAIQILSAYGIVKIYDYASKKISKIKPINYSLFVLILLLTSLTFFEEDYFMHAARRQGEGMHYGISELINYVNNNQTRYGKILMSRSLSVPNIWVEFFLKVDPKEVQAASKDWLKYETEGHLYLDQLSQYSLGKFSFDSIDLSKLKNEKSVLIVGKPDDFKYDTVVQYKINFLNGKPAYYIVDSSGI